jgi:hypothetical protein
MLTIRTSFSLLEPFDQTFVMENVAADYDLPDDVGTQVIVTDGALLVIHLTFVRNELLIADFRHPNVVVLRL